MYPFNADGVTIENFAGVFPCMKKSIVVLHALQINLPEGFTVTSNEGILTGHTGDYLMFGVDGEKYICAKDIFEKTYCRMDEVRVEAVDSFGSLSIKVVIPIFEIERARNVEALLDGYLDRIKKDFLAYVGSKHIR